MASTAPQQPSIHSTSSQTRPVSDVIDKNRRTTVAHVYWALSLRPEGAPVTPPGPPTVSEVTLPCPLHDDELWPRPRPLSSASETMGGVDMECSRTARRPGWLGQQRRGGRKVAGVDGAHEGLRAQFKGLRLERTAVGGASLGGVMRWDL